ncbi:PH and SEC7 domain-containing protein C11E3.11c [Choanephora cucurbitarum]|uniref:PH and SEC7 domain-containing protein C11E3.11c n=1 Tax=Choanephora cucurbitarum TaxID=101091 RepID=A0A1C7NNM4_9FUNG|nr:PH and SEC7 domain-containing protein C11E3.11c [Choanephora cucurbitarum]
MSVNNNYRRRSLSISDVSSALKMDSAASSLWGNNNKSKGGTFLSRLISTSNTASTPTPAAVSPTTSTSSYIPTSLPQVHSQQRIKRKPINSPSNTISGTNIDILSTSPVEKIPAATMPTSTRKKYELVLGVTDQELAKDLLKKDVSGNSCNANHGQSSAKGFGNIFKRAGNKSIEKNDNDLPIFNQKQPENPTVPTTKSPAETESFEPLPPLQFPSSQREELSLDFQHIEFSRSIENNNSGQTQKIQQQRYEIGERLSSAYNQENNKGTQSPNASRWSNASTRKSTGSYSIYSTFGSDSIFGEDGSSDNAVLTASTSLVDFDEKEQQVNESVANDELLQTIETNMQTRNPAKLVIIESSEEEEEEDDENCGEEDEDSSDNQADIFVDATGVSQEDIERERIEARLSKRLSGGHYGSAGGLMMSMMMPDGISKDSKKQRRRSRPPPEDVAQSMINWKRYSGQGQLKITKPPPEQIHQHVNEQQSNKLMTPSTASPLTAPEKDFNYTLPPQRPLPEGPLPPKPQPSVIVSDVCEDEQDVGKQTQNNHEIDINDPQECAARLWYEDSTFVESERIAEWLGQSKPLNTSTLHEYMKYFDFATMRLDSAFRKVCSKLYFRAEAQQIDRILEAFAKRYWECNPKTIFGSADVVYAVVYSLLLLNTDLHVAQGNHTKMTRQAFVKNTMSTIREQFQSVLKETPKSSSFILAWEAHIETYLKDMYVSVKNYQILQPTQHQNDTLNAHSDNSSMLSASSGSKRLSMIGGKRMIDIKRSLNTMMYKNPNARDSLYIQEEPVPRKSTSSTTHQQYLSNTRNMQSCKRRESVISTGSLNNSSGIIIPKTSSSSSTNSGLLSPNSSHMMSFMDTHSDSLFNNHPPYLKEGVVMRKHLLESPNQKAKHREWKECLLIVTQGQLKMYGMQSDGGNDSAFSGKYNMLRSGSASFANLADTLTRTTTNGSQSYGGASQHDGSSGWAAYSQLMESIDLSHSLANALPPPGYNRSRPHVFAVQQSNGGVYLIQSTSNEQIQEWVATCNYWAARQSKEPLQGGVGNIEYGWGSCLDDVVLDQDAIEKGKKIIGKYTNNPDLVNVSVWTPAAPTMIPSALDEEAQLEALQKYVDQLNEEINDHREIKKKIQVKFHNKCQNHSRAMANWEAKSKYMLHEIIKYQNYCNSLEDSIARRKKEKDQNEQESDDC